MRIIWFTWRDLKHPLAGGAELVTFEMTKRLARKGHNVTIVTSEYDGCKKRESVEGVDIVRMGNRFNVYWKAYKYYRKNLLDQKIDIIIDEMNTLPFFTSFYVGRQVKSFLFVHQLCREIWFHQIFFPLNIIGYLIEPVYLWLLRNSNVITISRSTKNDLIKYGFKKEKVAIISEGVHIQSADDLENVQKYQDFTILSLGAVRKMKRTVHQLRAFEIARQKIPNLKFKISGLINDSYGRRFVKLVDKSPYKKDIEFIGRVNDEEKKVLMQKCHLIVVTSIKEGWGLIVSEAGSQGTPAVVYDVDGLRDAVEYGKAGYITEQNTPEVLADKIVSVLSNKENYDKIRYVAYQKAKKITFDRGFDDFMSVIKK
jgi:glycosyltransferase involved in cell wall biosynthesis